MRLRAAGLCVLEHRIVETKHSRENLMAQIGRKG